MRCAGRNNDQGLAKNVTRRSLEVQGDCRNAIPRKETEVAVG